MELKEIIIKSGINIELSEAEQSMARLNVLRVMSKLDQNQSLAELIKELVVNYRPSSRRLAEIIYPEAHNSHGDQYSGRDLKRWAAIELHELFEDVAIVKLFDNQEPDYWHEW